MSYVLRKRKLSGSSEEINLEINNCPLFSHSTEVFFFIASDGTPRRNTYTTSVRYIGESRPTNHQSSLIG